MDREQEDWVVVGIPKDPSRPAAVWGEDSRLGKGTYYIWSTIQAFYDHHVRQHGGVSQWHVIKIVWNEEPPPRRIEHQTDFVWRRVSRSDFAAMTAMELARQMLADST